MKAAVELLLREAETQEAVAAEIATLEARLATIRPLGRPAKMTPAVCRDVARRLADGETVIAAARAAAVSRRSVYSAIARQRARRR